MANCTFLVGLLINGACDEYATIYGHDEAIKRAYELSIKNDDPIAILDPRKEECEYIVMGGSLFKQVEPIDVMSGELVNKF